MKSSYLNLSIGFSVFMLLTEISLAQQKKPTVYPYGGVPDTPDTSRTNIFSFF
ncbi:hypothetical protein IIA28_17960 [candidate division KSB1 bacterium]|nr:hypothetical protein [candidate division KSB1 bacterium]